MAELDELFGGEKNTEYKPFDKDEWIKQKQENRSAAFEMIDNAASALTDVSKLNTFLDVQSRFDRYSVSNALLVAEQKPDATRLCDSKQWQKHGAFIKKGEKGITILEPGEEFTREDGTTGVSYNPKKVFDISQTNAKPKEYHQKPVDFKKLVKALIKNSPVPINISENVPEDMNAVYSPESKAILIRQGMDGDEIFRALSYEISMARADKGDFSREANADKAYCVSYILCKRNNIEPQTADSGFKPFDGKETKDIRSALGSVRDEANNIASVIEKALEPKDKGAR